MVVATATEVQNNFGKYLRYAQNGQEVVVTKNGKEAARLISSKGKRAFLTSSLRGVLKKDYDYNQAKEEFLNERYDIDRR